MRYYKANKGNWCTNIEAVEAERATKDSVWIKGRRYAMFNSYESYLSSFEEAKAILISDAEKNLKQKEGQLSEAREYLEKIKSLKETI